jgi:hypothetical protein
MDASDTTRTKKALAYFGNKVEEFIAHDPSLAILKTNCDLNTKIYNLQFPNYELRKLFFDGRKKYLGCTNNC